MRTTWITLPLLALAACGPSETERPVDSQQDVGQVGSTDDPVDDPQPEEQPEEVDEECTPAIEMLGPEFPVVGDINQFWMYCDYADGGSVLLTGASVVLPFPVDAAYVDGNELEWIKPGEVNVQVQVGATRDTLLVVVEEEP